jgi:hypothetical protein
MHDRPFEVGFRLQHVPKGGSLRGVVHRGNCPEAAGGWLTPREGEIAYGMPGVTPGPAVTPAPVIAPIVGRSGTDEVTSYPGRPRSRRVGRRRRLRRAGP